MAVRLVAGARYNAHTEPLFKAQKILPLDQLIEFAKLQFMHSYVNGFLPSTFNDTWLTNQERQLNTNMPGLRSGNELYVPFARTSQCQRLPLWSFAKTWNCLEDHSVKIQRNKTAFNTALKRNMFDKLTENYICERLLCPFCHLGRNLFAQI